MAEAQADFIHDVSCLKYTYAEMLKIERLLGVDSQGTIPQAGITKMKAFSSALTPQSWNQAKVDIKRFLQTAYSADETASVSNIRNTILKSGGEWLNTLFNAHQSNKTTNEALPLTAEDLKNAKLDNKGFIPALVSEAEWNNTQYNLPSNLLTYQTGDAIENAVNHTWSALVPPSPSATVTTGQLSSTTSVAVATAPPTAVLKPTGTSSTTAGNSVVSTASPTSPSPSVTSQSSMQGVGKGWGSEAQKTFHQSLQAGVNKNQITCTVHYNDKNDVQLTENSSLDENKNKNIVYYTITKQTTPPGLRPPTASTAPSSSQPAPQIEVDFYVQDDRQQGFNQFDCVCSNNDSHTLRLALLTLMSAGFKEVDLSELKCQIIPTSSTNGSPSHPQWAADPLTQCKAMVMAKALNMKPMGVDFSTITLSQVQKDELSNWLGSDETQKMLEELRKTGTSPTTTEQRPFNGDFVNDLKANELRQALTLAAPASTNTPSLGPGQHH